jgi:hypothetical protein
MVRTEPTGSAPERGRAGEEEGDQPLAENEPVPATPVFELRPGLGREQVGRAGSDGNRD